MPRVLFLVHGMGENAPRWSATVRQKLDEVALRYPRFREQYPRGNVTELLDVREISYDGCFSRYVNDWDRSVSELAQFAELNEVHAGGALEDFSEVVDWVSRSAKPSEQRFFWSHAVDVLLYRFFPLVTDEVRVSVLEQMTAVLQGDDVVASVLSHSLGTKVAHDCLQLLGTVPFGGNESFLARNGYRFESLFTCANVSGILGRVRRGDADIYQSVVHPITTPANAAPKPGYCEAFYDFRHALDPFTLVKSFQPKGWGADFVAPAPLDHVAADWNVHGFTHFLDHPAVHAHILNALLAKDEPIVSDAELAIAVANYRVPSLPPCQQAMQDFIRKIEGLRARLRETNGDVRTFIVTIAEFYAAVEEAKDACR